jgi:hypothetical protein
MPDQHVYNNVTQTTFTCVKAKSYADHGTTYVPADANSGTATTNVTFVGEIQIDFNFNPSANTLTYSNLRKPGIVPESRIWDGIESTIKACGGG